MYHILSLGLGIFSWIFGGSAAIRGKFGGFAFTSLSFCCVSVTLELLELKRLAKIDDYSAFLDTIDAVSFAAGVLIILTLALNGIALLRQKNRRT